MRGCPQCGRVDEHAHGSLGTDRYELRYQKDERGVLRLDEVVARECTVHLEQMTEQRWWMGISLPGGRRIAVVVESRNGRSFVDAWAEIDT